MQAIKHVTQMKGPNGKVPCRACKAIGVYHTCRKGYYIPLANPANYPNAIPDSRPDPQDFLPNTIPLYNPLNLPLRTKARIADQLGEMDAANTKRQRDALSKNYGLINHSILDRIPLICWPDLYPHKYLHLFLLNHGCELISLWTGSCHGIDDSGNKDYLISADNWAAIGLETKEASKTLPAAFIRPLPNIQTSQAVFCGETWAFWLVFIGPVVLRGRLAKKYYEHYLELVEIMKCLTSVTNTTARIEQLRDEIAHYVKGFKELCVCKLTLHALLHVADDVLHCGPVWVAWSFCMERYCHEVTFCAKSKVVPYVTISKHVLHMGQIAAIANRFPSIRKALLFGKNDAPAPINEQHDIILRFPRLREFRLKGTIRQHVARWLAYLPERCERWGKLRIGDGGDCIRSAVACNPSSIYGKRDSSFVCRDENENDPDATVNMIGVTGYGRLDFILAVTFPTDQENEIDAPTTHVLAHITKAKDVEGDAAEERISFTKFGRSFVLDITSVKNVAGRVFTRATREAGEWVIIDRSGGICRTDFRVDEHDSDNEDGWAN
ncbi:hypothetical protein RhiTH_003712 [Rhizoctonia solani]